jgi:predicted ABC-type ATPase
MKTCYVMVGLPACGKSTRVTSMCYTDPDAFVYSTDNLIEKWSAKEGLTYNDGFSTYIKEATQHMNENLRLALMSDMNVIWDQTNLGKKKRSKIINQLKAAGYDVKCECFMPPEDANDIEEWEHRLVNRPGKTIPDFIMKNMKQSFEIPELSEGFSEILFWEDIYQHESRIVK